MLTRIIDLCLAHRPIVLLATVLIAAIGIASFKHLPIDAFPDTTPVQVQVNTNAPALSPLEVEQQITYPIEQAIAGMPGLLEVRSISKFGYSQITVIFEDHTNIYLARQLVAERIGATPLPQGIQRPTLGPVSSGLGEVFQYLVRSDTLSPQELRTLHHWVIRPRMLQVSGVAEINTWGGFEKQYHVLINPHSLIEHQLTLDDVADVLKQGNRNAGGGNLDIAGESQLIRGQGLVKSIEELEAMVLAHVDGVPIYLHDVAEVKEGHQIRRGAVTAEGKGEVVLGLGFMLMGENSYEVTSKLEQRLAEVARDLPETVSLQTVYSRNSLVDQVLLTIRNNLLEGALLVIAVLFMFMGNIRAGLIVALAIPLSMLFAFSAMLQFGIVGSLMSLGAIDFGLVVDSSVIMVENSARRLEEDKSGRSVLEIVRDAAVEVRKPTLFGELIIAIVYLPILTLEGIEGKLFRPMALTVIFALLGSMIFSMTLMPVLASYALKRGRHKRNRLVLWLEKHYDALLSVALSHNKLVLALAALVVLVAGFLATNLGTVFVPRLLEQAIVINTVRMAGVSLGESVRYGSQIEALLLDEYPQEIAHIWTRTGTAEVATDPMGLEVSDVFLTLTPRKQWTRALTQDQLMQAMATSLEGMPGMRSIFTQPIEMRVNEMIAGIRSDLAIKLFGDDLNILEARGEMIRAITEGIPGAADVTLEQLTGQAMLTIDIDREAAGRHGVEVGEILELVETLGTRKVGEIYEGMRTFDLVLRLNEEARQDAQAIESILIHTETGAQIPLSRVASVKIVEGPSTIQREWAKRRIVIQTNVRGRDMGSFINQLRQELKENLELPEGYFIQLGGQYENMERARQRLMVVVPIALLLVFSLLYLTYGSMSDTLRIFTGVPFAAVGGIASLWLTGIPFSISAGVGFIALSGVSVLGDMVLASRVKQLIQQGNKLPDAIREGARNRLRPVLMTGLVAAIGFLPMALNTGVGAEIQKPLAVVVIGGIITSTIATLLVLPVLYLVFDSTKNTTKHFLSLDKPKKAPE